MSGAPERLARAPVVVAALASLALAVAVLPATPGMGDSAELTLAIALAGIPHPTGYPIYVLAGHGFASALHAFGASWVLTANLWSAVGAAVAVGAYTRLLQHLSAAFEEQDLREGRAPGVRGARAAAIALPVIALVLNPVWMDSATIAEVYSWNNAWLAIAAAFAIGRLRALTREAERGNVEGAAAKNSVIGGAAAARQFAAADTRAAFQWGLLCGMCGAHHVTSLFFVVALSVALITAHAGAGRWRGSLVLVALGGAAVPLTSYAWIPWRAAHPSLSQWPVGPSARALWLHVSGAAYAHYLGRFAPSRDEWTLLRSAVVPWILPGMVFGSIVGVRCRSRAIRRGMLALLAAAALQVAFVVSYGVTDPRFYLLPALMSGLLVGTPALLWLSRRTSALVAPGLVALVALALATWSIPRARAERSRLATVDAGFRAAWNSVPFDRGIVLWRDDHYLRFKVLQLLEGRRSGLYVESPDMLIWPARRSAFQRTFGFDPLEGLTLRTPEDIARISESIRRRATVPVLVLREEPPANRSR